MLFRALTLIASLVTILSAEASFYTNSPSFLSSMEGRVTDYYRLTSDNASQIEFAPIKSMLYTDKGLTREEQFANGPLEAPVVTRLNLSDWVNPSGSLKIKECGTIDMGYRKELVSTPFDATFGQIVVEEEDANHYLLEIYRSKFKSLLQMKTLDHFSLTHSISKKGVIHDLWIGQVNCTHIVDQWVKEVGYIDRGLACTTEFIFEYTLGLLDY